MQRRNLIRDSIATALAAAVAITSVSPVFAGPTVIRDEMLRDTAITPVLGRGYSIATNTYQSICLAGIAKTKPSYNFNYLFQEMQEDGSVAKQTSSASSSSYFHYSFNIFSISGGSGASSTRQDEKTKRVWHKHSMMVTILIDVYYSSVDESASKLSPSAASLLTNKDIPGFFDACGMYYIRSISRQAALISKFTYESQTTTRDTSFESHIKSEVWSFGLSGGIDRASADSSSASQESFSASNLTIQTVGMGLGKDESVSLISYDLKTFKNAIKGAFAATQPEDVGMVTAIEVSPWVENSEFQNLNKLVPTQVPELDSMGREIYDPAPDPTLPPKRRMKTIMPYAQKRILTQNSEFLAEADRAARAKLNIYYKAKACKTQIELDNMNMRQGGKWEWRELPPPPGSDPIASALVTQDRGDLWVVNNRTYEDSIQIRDLYAMLSPQNMAMLWLEYDSFVYGGMGPDVEAADKSQAERNKLANEYLSGQKPPGPLPRNLFPGASRCLEDLSEAGIQLKSYRSIKTCERLEELFVVVSGRGVDDYCSPSFGPPPKKAGFAGGNSSGMGDVPR